MSDSLGDTTGQHAEGVQHIASKSDASRGAEGGVGSSEKLNSPLYPGGSSGTTGTTGSNLEQTSSQGGVVETVKSYLGYGSNSGTGAAETGQLGTTGDGRNVAEDTSTGSGSGAGVSGAAASAASAVGLGSGNSAAGGGLGSTSSSSGVTTGDSTTGSSSTTGGSTLEAAKEKAQEVTGTSGKSREVTSGTDDHKPPQPAGGKPHKLENESSIPTAGGERLGEKHWGESKIVPDNPDKRPSAAGVSSEAGQPTQTTTDNTAKNMGGATGPPGGSNTGSSDNSGSGNTGEEKTKMTDKIKDKLHIGKKE